MPYAAARLADQILADLPARLRHTAAVAERAATLTSAAQPRERPVLLAAAWLHDIGYAPQLHGTGFHPLDGAYYLQRHGWPQLMCRLVAHHSGARFVATVRGLTEPLSCFPHRASRLYDALTFADQTTGPHGEAMTVPTHGRDAAPPRPRLTQRPRPPAPPTGHRRLRDARRHPAEAPR